MALLLDALNEIINPFLNVPTFALQEANPAGRHPAIKLHKNKDDCVLILSFEQCHSALQRPCGCLSAWIHPLLRDGLGLRESCDYVAFRETDDALWIFLIELKSNYADHARRQIARTRIVADYLIETARHYRSLPRPATINYRGIVFKENARVQKVGPKSAFTYTFNYSGMRDLGLTTQPRGPCYHLSAFCA